jgi:MYXO-CTERM domain-containing protein
MKRQLAFAIGFLVAGAPLVSMGQTQIKPRVMIMVDTSGSMLDDFAGTGTGGDGSTRYSDSLITRDVSTSFNLTPYIGTEVSSVTNQCIPTNTPPANEVYSGFNSRLFAAKKAVTNVVNGSGDVDWGLMRYTGTTCAVQTHTFTNTALVEPAGRCFVNGQCAAGRTCNTTSHRCTCTVAGDCPAGFICGTTGADAGLCTANSNGDCTTPGWSRTANTCVCTADSQCPQGACNGGICTCSGNVAPNADLSCTCATDTTCGGGFCIGARCGTYADFFAQPCAASAECETGQTCTGGKCTCTRDDDCRNINIGFNVAQVCGTGGFCGIDLNMCVFGGYAETSTRDNTTCGNHNVPIGATYNGSCGTGGTANTAPCNNKLVCYVNSDCGTAGSCVKAAATDAWGECACTTGGATQCRNADYTCTGNRCLYNQACQSDGGAILVDPASASYTPSTIILYANGKEDVVNNDPELRAAGSTPLAGSARTATTWYNTIKNYSLVAGTSTNCLAGLDNNPLCDPKILCRPYVLVQMTDGDDRCEAGDQDEGPIAAAAGFVDVTAAGARVPNKVYVVGLAASGTLQGILNTTAKFGGTGQAAFANNQSDIERALGDIIVSSVLVEKCNYIDDDCNNVSDEPFPDVNAACNNGAVGHCAANGKFKCATDQLSETCGPVSCRNGAGTALTKGAGNAMTLTGVLGFTAADVGQSITIVSTRLPANRGTFVITATTAASVTFTVPGGAGVAEAFPVGYEIYCTQQTSCRGNNLAVGLTKNGNSMTLAGVSGFTAADVGGAITISGATNTVNNGTFVITAQTGTTVTFTNTAGVAQAAGAITWAVDCRAPSCKRGTAANLSGKAGNNINLVAAAGSPAFVAGDVGKTLTIHSAQNPLNVGNFTIAAFVNATTVTLTSPNGANEAASQVAWNIYCVNAESVGGCNNFDDDCNGVPDDCTEGVAGSCCTSNGCLPVELCNGIDDDCNGIIDDNPVDVGANCGNAVGDCLPGVVKCCAVDPSTNGGVCTSPAATDKPYCVGGTPGFPKASDLCDGTDDDCDGVANNVPPQPCYNDPTATPNPFNPALAGHGICQAGSQLCTTVPLPAGSPGCPSPWPAASPCPNATPTFGACVNARGPQQEVCNGLDDNCNDIPDDNVNDSWVGNDCCPTGNLNDCTNTGGGSFCQFGKLACQSGGQVCVGGQAKSVEICDGIDNDCNGKIDDVPGLGSTCAANGVINAGACKATFICVVGSPGMCDGVPCPNGLTCNQTGTPQPEVCNGVDDDCNNIVDDPAEVVVNDPALMMPCDVPAPPNDKPPCMPGSPVCLNGKVQCEGAVTPIPNVCGQAPTDCTGNPSMTCPDGAMCFQGNCVTECGAGEFPCPGGFVCDRTQTPALCIPDACAKANCAPGQNCTVDSTGAAVCSDPCANIDCPSGFRCQNGACVDDTCNTFGCPTGEVCLGQPPACVANPCANIECDTSQYCSNGDCVPLCPATCMTGERCVDGLCTSDPCAGVHCSAGQVCAITGGVGMCVSNTCVGTTCGANQVCCGGACNNDPCKLIKCPAGIICIFDTACNATCNEGASPPKEQIVGAGGGGFSCAVSTGSSNGWLALLALAYVLVRRRRRQEEVR